MPFALIDGERVCAVSLLDKAPDGWVEVPSVPKLSPGHHYALKDGRIILALDEPESRRLRAAAYRATVDPITCEIQRLRDMGGSAQEIAEAEARREAAVAAIKAQWPYPEEEVSMADSSQL